MFQRNRKRQGNRLRNRRSNANPNDGISNAPSLSGNNKSSLSNGDSSQFVGKFPSLPEPDTINRFGITNETANSNSSISLFDAEEEFAGTITSSEIRKMRDQLPVYEIERVQFGVMSERTKVELAVANISNANHYGSGSINDARFGVVPGNNTCSTCNLPLDTCPGHYGRINISKYPIYHPLFIKDVVDVLTCTCSTCGSLLISEEMIKEKKFDYIEGFKRINVIATYISKAGLTCRGRLDVKKGIKKPLISTIEGLEEGETTRCQLNPAYKSSPDDVKKGVIEMISDRNTTKDEKIEMKRQKFKDPSIIVRQKKEQSRGLHPDEAYAILDMISDEDATLLGFSKGTHPRDLITKSLLTIPPAYRGASLMRPGANPIDKIGPVYIDILKKLYPKKNTKKNIRVLTVEEIRHFIYDKFSDLMLFKAAEGTSGSRSYKGIFTQLNGKKGVLRQLALGKRVDYTARSVIGPNPFLSVDEVGIPRIWRSELTVQRTARPYNSKALLEVIKAGHASAVTHGGGQKKGRITRIDDRNRNTIKLFYGDTVHCWLRDGDYVTFNRQPSLHKQNLMGHRVKLVDSLNIQMHPSATSPYNADHDGDEMNIHAPQTVESRTEVSELMSLKHCLMNEQSNTAMIGLIMSDITGAYIMTSQFHNISMPTWHSCRQLITDKEQLLTFEQRLAKYGVANYTGRALFSMLLPADFNYTKGSVSIRNGILVKGIITKGIIGVSGGSIAQVMKNDYGDDRTVRFLSDSSRVINRWFSTYGFSIGLESCSHTNPEIAELKEELLAYTRLTMRKMGHKLEDPEEERKRKEEVVTSLSAKSNEAMKLMEKTFGKYNRLAQMILAGSKGSTFNSSQIAIMLGMQYSGGEIIKDSLTNQTRTHPTFEPNDPDPTARGYVLKSFSEGLDPAGAFFHGIGTRINVMDTALATANVGDLSRTLHVALSDYYIEYDGSVRNSVGEIISFVYGEEGMDPGKLQEIKVGKKKIPFFIDLKNTIQRLNDTYGYFEPEEIEYSRPEEILAALIAPTEKDAEYVNPNSLYQIRNIMFFEGGKEALINLVKRYYDIEDSVLDDLFASIDDTDGIVDTEFYEQLYNNLNNDGSYYNKYGQYEYDNADLIADASGLDDVEIDAEENYVHAGKNYKVDDEESDFAHQLTFNIGFEEIKYLLDDPKESDDGVLDSSHRVSEDGKLPYDDGEISLMTWTDTLNNVEDIDLTLEEISRVMKRDGYLMLREYDVDNDLDKMLADVEQMLLLNLNGKYDTDVASEYVGAYKSRNEWSGLLDKYGFERQGDSMLKDDVVGKFWGLYKYSG